MCGICGILDTTDSAFPARQIQAMANAIRHRGPDDHGVFYSEPTAFGFRRLSIVDLAGGKQPMCNEDSTICIVFNGEIYNHRELRPELERRGHRYSSNSDTETILHLYEEYGPDCVHRLRGMFSFSIWDTTKQRLFCARDRLGIKPFYYALHDGRFIFASEIKSIFESGKISPTLNPCALPEFFAFGYLASDETLFAGVRKLMPGHRLTIDLKAPDRSPQISKYWELDVASPATRQTDAELIGEFGSLFRDTIESHLMSDVPIGIFLSGGLDSSAIAAEMASLRKERIKTFSVGYKDDRFSELPYARLMARHVGSEHHEVFLGADDFFDALPSLIWNEDEPLVWPSSVSLFFVSRLAAKQVKVVLTGEGGDELFAGYLKYRATVWNVRAGNYYRRLAPEALQSFARRFLSLPVGPDWAMRKLRHTFLYHSDRFEQLHFDNFYCAFPQAEHEELFTSEFLGQVCGVDPYANSMKYSPSPDANGDLLNRLLYLDIKTYLVELLMKQDQMSMAASLESRVPFLDHRLVEFAARLPAKMKVRGFSGKYLLRRAMEDRLPREILHRAKKGFPTPIRPWLRGPLYYRLESILTDGRLAERKIVRPDYVNSLLGAHQRGSSRATEGCWRLLNFELWNRLFLDRDPAVLRNSRAATPEDAALCA